MLDYLKEKRKRKSADSYQTNKCHTIKEKERKTKNCRHLIRQKKYKYFICLFKRTSTLREKQNSFHKLKLNNLNFKNSRIVSIYKKN